MNTVLNNFGWLLRGQLLTRCFSLVLSMSATRMLGPRGFGEYATALSFAAFFAVLLEFGLSTVLIRDVARVRAFAGLGFGSVCATKCLYAVITAAAAGLILKKSPYSSQIVFGIGLMFLASSIASLSATLRAVFQAFQILKYDTALLVLTRGILLAAGLAALTWRSVVMLWTAHIAAELLGLLAGFLIARRAGLLANLGIRLDVMKRGAVAAVPFGLSSLFGIAYYQIDAVLLSMIRGSVEVGYYQAAYGLILSLLFIPGMFVTALFPSLCQCFARNDLGAFGTQVYRSTRYMLMIGLPISVGTSLLAGNIVVSLFGASYLPSALPLRILAWGLPLTFLNYVLTKVLQSSDRQRIVLWVAVAATLVNVAANLIVIPRAGYIGAAWTTIATEGFVFITNSLALKKHYSVEMLAALLKLSLANIIMALILIAIGSRLPLAFGVLLGAGTYAVALLGLRSFAGEDRELLQVLTA